MTNQDPQNPDQNPAESQSSAEVVPESASPQAEKEQERLYTESMRAVVMGEVMREWPQDLFIPPDALEVVLESFEGPLDLLLYLSLIHI